MKLHLLSLILLILLIACDSDNRLGEGYELIDGGGSKTSLSKNGIIIIDYVVTGTGRYRQFLIVETRDYGSVRCNYFFSNPRNGKLIQILEARGSNSTSTFTSMLKSVNPINNRSCQAAINSRSRELR